MSSYLSFLRSRTRPEVKPTFPVAVLVGDLDNLDLAYDYLITSPEFRTDLRPEIHLKSARTAYTLARQTPPAITDSCLTVHFTADELGALRALCVTMQAYLGACLRTETDPDRIRYDLVWAEEYRTLPRVLRVKGGVQS